MDFNTLKSHKKSHKNFHKKIQKKLIKIFKKSIA